MLNQTPTPSDTYPLIAIDSIGKKLETLLYDFFFHVNKCIMNGGAEMCLTSMVVDI